VPRFICYLPTRFALIAAFASSGRELMPASTWEMLREDQRQLPVMPRLISYDSSAARGSILMTRPNMQGISPFFIVSNVDHTIAFYCDELGFETRFQEPDRNPFFAIIGRDGAQLFVTFCRCRTPSVIPP